ncbi:TPA: hypothetical protein RY409_004568 [Escherichia albertii]|uniref:hypothetical protein n=1 Tax=Escherichia albertii TaxID=208962 RepID=UPI000743F361|nr:hypothetical protein [Escherichia albertii]MCZ8591932.1 hypothetical protein [Escherichia albertii]MCZ8777351.1 hypothetical protein [Escherichia albertii]WDB36153.1 hypothetical protein PS032_10420 [Escherichia albertii]WDB72600.1 hypothetical protein PS034_13770 [Escherichia albertii]WDB80662.1 hypothetical protein PS039_08635 [Escherichia albertii]
MGNNTISAQELLDCISRLREDVNTLTIAFSYLAFSIPREQMQSTLASIQFESRNPKWSREQQNSFKWLAALLEEKYAGKITIPAESSENQ